MRTILPAFLLILSGSTTAAAQAPAAGNELQSALDAIVAGNLDSAEATLRAAIGATPAAPAPRCELASIDRLRGSFEPALAGYRECVRLARAARDVVYEARGLLGTLQTLERLRTLESPGRLTETRAAATALLEFAEAHPEVIRVEVARARLGVVDAAIELDAVSTEVRTRRDARAAQVTE